MRLLHTVIVNCKICAFQVFLRTYLLTYKQQVIAGKHHRLALFIGMRSLMPKPDTGDTLRSVSGYR